MDVIDKNVRHTPQRMGRVPYVTDRGGKDKSSADGRREDSSAQAWEQGLVVTAAMTTSALAARRRCRLSLAPASEKDGTTGSGRPASQVIEDLSQDGKDWLLG